MKNVFRNTFAVAIFALSAGSAAATNVDPFEQTVANGTQGPGGNYCGDPGQSFDNGVDPAVVCDVGGSPWIVKYEFSEQTGSWNLAEFNSAFGSPSDFGGITIDDEGNGEWSFTYTPDSDDPGITAFAAKGSASNNLYEYMGDGAFFGGESISFVFPQGNSNVTFFDSDGPMEVIPLPAAGWLLLAGLGGLGLMRRRSRAAA